MNSRKNLRIIILLESDSNITIFSKKELVDKVINSKDSTIVGINRDGTLKPNKECTILLFEEKYQFNKDLISNIFSLVDIVDNYHITIDTAVDCTFDIHFLDKVLKLIQFTNHLYNLDSAYKMNILSLEEYNKLLGTKKKT
jgi:hypothetical protein